MHVEEMRRREDYEGILLQSLTQGLSAWFGCEVRATRNGGAQTWLYQRLFSAYHARRPSRDVLRWLSASLRHTPRRWLAPAQFAGASLAATRGGTVLLGRQGFSLSVGFENAADALIVPGNQRLRVFCFDRGLSRVWPKVGFSTQRLEVEVRARQGAREGFFVPLRRWAKDYSWLEEGLVEGVPLPRCAPVQRQQVDLVRLFEELDAWSGSAVREVEAIGYAQALAQEGEGLISQLQRRFAGELGARFSLGRLVRQASVLGRLQLSRSHGDLQPGNLLVTPQGVRVIDWEHSRERMSGYDRLVFGLAARQAGWEVRVADFLSGNAVAPLALEQESSARRRALLSLFALEDLLWHLREASSGPYLGLTAGVRHASRTAVRVASL